MIRPGDLERLERLFPSETAVGKGEKVYFLQRGETGPIKIGISKNPKKRITAIQGLCAEPVEVLLLLSVDSRQKEREIHEKFKHLRLKGEWFEPAPDLLGWIEEHRSDD